jgi:hypothetical protein
MFKNSYETLKCKIHTIPILMYQMHISTNDVSSVAQAEKFGNSKFYDCKEPEKNPSDDK